MTYDATTLDLIQVAVVLQGTNDLNSLGYWLCIKWVFGFDF